MASIIKSAKFAKNVLQRILDDRKVVEEKGELQLGALDWGARALEKANANGACLYREAVIVRYQASHAAAVLLPCETYTREALKAAVWALDKMAQQEAGERDD